MASDPGNKSVATVDRLGRELAGEPDHQINRRADGTIEDRFDLGRSELVVVHSQLHYGETTEIWCKCGEDFEDLDEAEAHLREILSDE